MRRSNGECWRGNDSLVVWQLACVQASKTQEEKNMDGGDERLRERQGLSKDALSGAEPTTNSLEDAALSEADSIIECESALFC